MTTTHWIKPKAKCLNCDKEIDLLSQFCSSKCLDHWQSKNQTCNSCEKEMNLLEDEYTIRRNGDKAIILCQTCGHGDYSDG